MSKYPKIVDTRAATNQLARLKTVIEAQLVGMPDLKKRCRKTKISGHDYLTLSLDGSLIPWDEVPISDYEKEEGEFQELIDHLKNMKLTPTANSTGETNKNGRATFRSRGYSPLATNSHACISTHGELRISPERMPTLI